MLERISFTHSAEVSQMNCDWLLSQTFSTWACCDFKLGCSNWIIKIISDFDKILFNFLAWRNIWCMISFSNVNLNVVIFVSFCKMTNIKWKYLKCYNCLHRNATMEIHIRSIFLLLLIYLALLTLRWKQRKICLFYVGIWLLVFLCYKLNW